jgi:hypothetical protein
MLELKSIQRMDLNLEYYTTKSICDAICSISSLGKKGIQRKDVLDYLLSVNSIIEDVYSDDLEKHILAASGIYIFADPLIHIIRDKKDIKIKDNYIKRLKNSPYNIDEPLHPYFLKADQDYFNSPEESKLIKVTDELMDNQVSFSRSDNFNQQITQELSYISKLLSPSGIRKNYSRTKHFAFVGYYDVCRSIFNVKVKKSYYEEINSLLAQNFGFWMIQSPNI